MGSHTVFSAVVHNRISVTFYRQWKKKGQSYSKSKSGNQQRTYGAIIKRALPLRSSLKSATLSSNLIGPGCDWNMGDVNLASLDMEGRCTFTTTQNLGTSGRIIGIAAWSLRLWRWFCVGWLLLPDKLHRISETENRENEWLSLAPIETYCST